MSRIGSHMRKHIGLLFTLLPLLAQAGFGGMANVEDDGGSSHSGDTAAFFVLVGAGLGAIIGGLNGWATKPSMVIGGVLGFIFAVVAA